MMEEIYDIDPYNEEIWDDNLNINNKYQGIVYAPYIISETIPIISESSFEPGNRTPHDQ